MKFLVLALLQFCILNSACFGLHSEAIAYYRNTINAALSNPTKENILKLGDDLESLSRNLDQSDSANFKIYKELQKALLGISDHGSYFKNAIKDARAANVIENEQTGRTYWRDYDFARSSAITTLTHLPSPESVHVLVELLADTEETGEPITADHQPDSFGPPSNAILATNALEQLIENPPPPEFMDVYDRGLILAWQHWHERIKAGKQTFRFKGNPTEYDHNGPASKEKLQRIAHDQQRDEGRKAGRANAASGTELAVVTSQIRKPFPFVGILGGCVITALIAWYFLRNRRMRRRN
jgi:hypothetical protein